jgi:micrococcal nuclease
VVDGDTLLLANLARVRLIGVDAPETVDPNRPPEPFGREAAEFTRQAVEGRVVRLEFDRERTDRYGRFLAYVYVGQSLVNEELVRAGLGRAETRFRYRGDMKRRFLDAEEEARSDARGIWSAHGQPRSSRPQVPQRDSLVL